MHPKIMRTSWAAKGMMTRFERGRGTEKLPGG